MVRIRFNLVEVVRVELTSYSAAKKLSTCVVYLLFLTFATRVNTLCKPQKAKYSLKNTFRSFKEFSVCLTPRPQPTDRLGATLVLKNDVTLQERSLHCYLHLYLAECFYAGTPSATRLFFRSPAIESGAPPYMTLSIYYIRFFRKSKSLSRKKRYNFSFIFSK